MLYKQQHYINLFNAHQSIYPANRNSTRTSMFFSPGKKCLGGCSLVLLLFNIAAHQTSAIFCESGPENLRNLGNREEQDFNCSGTSAGQVRIYWEAEDTSFVVADDE